MGSFLSITLVYRVGDFPVATNFVTENGAAYNDLVQEERGESFVHDAERVDYLRQHLEMSLKAIQEGAPLAGYFIWSLLDNFEWAYGYAKRFGIIYVDYPTQERIIKDSGWWYRKLLKG